MRSKDMLCAFKSIMSVMLSKNTLYVLMRNMLSKDVLCIPIITVNDMLSKDLTSVLIRTVYVMLPKDMLYVLIRTVYLIPLFHTGHESPELPRIDFLLIRGDS